MSHHLKLTSTIKFKTGIMSSLITLLLFPLFVYLGTWQLQRMNEKKSLEQVLEKNSQLPALIFNPQIGKDIENDFKDFHFRGIEITGEFLNTFNMLLDNQTLSGRPGYRVFTPFRWINSANTPSPPSVSQKRTSPFKSSLILIDRGWIPYGNNRNAPPIIPPIPGQVTVLGTLVKPPSPGFKFLRSKTNDIPELLIPNTRRIQNLNLQTLAQTLKLTPEDFYNFVVQLSSTNVPSSHKPYLSSYRHLGYAVQWFTMAAVVLIYFLIIGIRFNLKSNSPIR